MQCGVFGSIPGLSTHSLDASSTLLPTLYHDIKKYLQTLQNIPPGAKLTHLRTTALERSDTELMDVLLLLENSSDHLLNTQFSVLGILHELSLLSEQPCEMCLKVCRLGQPIYEVSHLFCQPNP